MKRITLKKLESCHLAFYLHFISNQLNNYLCGNYKVTVTLLHMLLCLGHFFIHKRDTEPLNGRNTLKKSLTEYFLLLIISAKM